ncbi:MAG: hypothetical protein LLF28_07875 [Nitrospiraceae bacterium]|nr:hypothetical protein [Nitrospiraceae bacterium]
MVESGADTFTAKKLMRHADLQSTLKYFHPTEERIYDIINIRGTTRNNEGKRGKNQ